MLRHGSDGVVFGAEEIITHLKKEVAIWNNDILNNYTAIFFLNIPSGIRSR